MTLHTGSIPLYQKQGRVWLQRTEMYPYILIDRAGMTSIVWPASAPTAIRAQSNLTRMGSKVIDITEGDADLPTFSIPTTTNQSKNILNAIGGEYVHVQLLTGSNGNPTQYGSNPYGLGWVRCLRGAATTDAGAVLDNAGEGVPMGTEFPMAGTYGPIPVDWSIALTRIAAVETEAFADIFCLPTFKDPDPARRVLPGEVGMIVSESAVAPALSEIYYTQNFFATITNVTTDPFAAGDSATFVVGYGDKREARFIAGSVAVAAPSIAYTDDYGVTWTTPTVGNATAGDIPNKGWVVDASHVYAVGGQAGSSILWESNDGGASWPATQEYDLGLAQPLNDICVLPDGYGWAVGDSNTISHCTNFNDWATITGPAGGAGDAILCVASKQTSGTTFIGNDAGELYYTQDDGESWVTATNRIQGYTATSINHIRFADEGEYGYMEITTATERVILRTTDGGNSWKNYSLSNAGLTNIAKNGMHVVGPNHVLAAGAASGGTASLVRAKSDWAAETQY